MKTTLTLILVLPALLFAMVKEKDGTLIFTLRIKANSVTVAGTFNNWDPKANPMEEKEQGTWETEIKVPPGRHEYKFVVNGTQWLTDPDNPNKTPDPYGGFNSVVIVAGSKGFKNLEYTPEGVIFRFYEPSAEQVFLAGTFNNWAPNALPMKKSDDYWEVTVQLSPGVHQYKFVINGNVWKEDPMNPARVDDGYGGFNSIFILTEEGNIIQKVPESPISKPIGTTLPKLGQPVYLAIVWHQHQPRYFKDPKTGEYEEPWVRLHAIKDYYDMAAILEEFPNIHLTINLTPVLLMQLEDLIYRYEKGLSPDKYVRLTLKDADTLTNEDKAFLLNNFFSANYDNMIDIWSRYRELRLKRVIRADGSVDIHASLPNFTEQDFRDLQVWFNLAWFDPDFQEREVVLPTGDTVSVKKFIEKEKNFTENDKKEIIDLQFKILKAVIPIHRKLMDKGQIEVTTTPFYHPILPLIYNTDLAREAMPLTPLPPKFSYPEDAKWHVKKAYDYYVQKFGRPPLGLWPAEGAVAKAIIDIVKETGFQWMASDVQVLARSFGLPSLNMKMRYQPFRAIGKNQEIFMVFRDTDLSDRIGFRYKSMDPMAAVNDFVQTLYSVHKTFANESKPALVTVILDGENAWEWYKHDGKEFLRTFYQQLQEIDWIKTVTVSEFIKQFPPDQRIENLFAGSWIGADFSTWIGENEENLAWELLGKVRKDFEKFRLTDEFTTESLNNAFEYIAIAEGSDWFWWLGADQTSPGGDTRFEQAFLKTLKSVYLTLNKSVPDFLKTSIIGAGVPGRKYGAMTPGTSSQSLQKLPTILDIKDPTGDDNGPGYYSYPTDPAFEKGIFDLIRFRVLNGQNEDYWILTFNKLTNPWNAPLGFSHPLILIYVGEEGKTGKTDLASNVLKSVKFDSNYPWQLKFQIAGWPDYGLLLTTHKGKAKSGVFQAWAEKNDVIVKIPHSLYKLKKGSYLTVIVCSQDGYAEEQIRPLDPSPSQWRLGGKKNPQDPPILDILNPDWTEVTQQKLLSPPYILVPSVRYR